MDTTAARRAIFNRIRKAQNRSAQPTPAEREAVRDYLGRHPSGPRPTLGDDLVEHFKHQVHRVAGTTDDVSGMDGVPAAAAAYLDENGGHRHAIGWNTLASFDWRGAGIDMAFRPPVNEDLVGITGCFCAIAETGTLMLLSSPDTFSSAALLPETYIAIVPASRIVGSMEDAFALVRKERGELPRATNFISGPSRTADIEQTIVLGAHGPYRMHLIIVRDA
jgi:L-lactate dehydrogenase complex protein LldG